MARARTAAPPSLRVHEFLALVHQGVESRLGKRLDGMTMRQRFSFVQYYRGGPDVHYEVWAQKKTGRIEIGLHFESPDRDANYGAAAALAAHAPQVQAAIGPAYELEEWTQTWTRLHHTTAAPALTSEIADDAAEQAVALIRGMEPIIEALGLRDTSARHSLKAGAGKLMRSRTATASVGPRNGRPTKP
jgi:hypothetical protein